MSSSDSRALLVDGLALSVTLEDLREAFAPFGSVLSTRVATDAFGTSLGFGYVVMATEEQAVRALANLHGRSLAGRILRVSVRHQSHLDASSRPRSA